MTEVTQSCGCVFCDLGLKPVRMRRQNVHYVKGEGKLVVCLSADQGLRAPRAADPTVAPINFDLTTRKERKRFFRNTDQ